MAQQIDPEALDGRRQRSERSRAAIIDAALSLIDEGILVPTAQQIADRADVGMRTFFRHFDDMEVLFVAVSASARYNYRAPFLGGDRSGTLEERIEKLVRQRAAGYEDITLIMLSTYSQSWKSTFLKQAIAEAQRDLRRNLEDWLPELKELSKAQREAADAVASFDMWHRLREHQKLNRKSSTGVIDTLLKQLLL